MTTSFDVVVLGAGMAGASLAAEIAPHRKVLLLEVEDEAGRHATGRSAAMFFESYGNATVCALTRASRAFLERPPAGFAATALMAPRAALFVADAEALPRLDAMIDAPDAAPTLRRLDAAAAIAQVPILRRERLAGVAFDDSGCDIDVAALHEGYLRAARRAGARIVLGAREALPMRDAGRWVLRTRAGEFAAPVLVNATGAWADAVARAAGVATIGLQPKRRTAMTIPAPAGHDIRAWPLTIDVDETVYFKPDAGQLLLSPANEDPMEPCDAAPEELDIAIAVDRFESMTDQSVARVNRRWAGLRSFVADKSPVAGLDPGEDGFFWLAGQGGYGIQMAPALARAAAALLLGRALPDDIAAQGVSAADISPTRATLRRGG